MTDRDALVKLRELEAKATPGPWEAHQGVLADQPRTWDVTSKSGWSVSCEDTPQGWFLATVHEVESEASAAADAALIVALRNDAMRIIEQQAAEIARKDAALRRSREGWENVLDFRLVPPQHRDTAQNLADECYAALKGQP